MSREQGGRSSAWALGCALALHACVIAGAAALKPKAPLPRAALQPLDAPIEVSLDPSAHTAMPHAPSSAAAAVPSPAAIARSTPGGIAHRALDPKVSEGEASAPPESSASAGPENVPPPLLPRRQLALGLDGSITRRLLLEDARDPKKAHRPSPGLLEEGLAEMAARRGSGRSSAAIQAAIGAARLGPNDGSAVFELRADARGNVVSVTLVSFGSSPARWNAVASDLERRLAKRKLRVPPGAAGLSTVFRIERGALAQEVPSQQKLKRGVALGQDSLGPKDVRDESTRAQLENGRVSPTSNLSGLSGSSGAPTRVVLLSERVL